MAQKVTADAKELRAFAAKLSNVESQLGGVESSLKSAMAQVSNSWKDPQRNKCEQEIQQLVAQLRQFQQKAEVQRAYCNRLAGHIESTPS